MDSFQWGAVLIAANITVIDSGQMQWFGKSRGTMGFIWQEPPSTFYHLDRVVDSIGIVFTEIEGGYNISLAGAVLNGVTYGTVTSVALPTRGQTSTYTLSQNYPNPFNPSTIIQYTLPHHSHVTLSVFNTLGQKVAELVNSEIEPGTHEVKFDGSRLASGVYFYRMQSGEFVNTKSFVLMR